MTPDSQSPGLQLGPQFGPEPSTVQVRAGAGWQYALADLSMILFLVTASALAGQGHPAPPPPATPRPRVDAVALADPVAVWRSGADAPSLGEWLAGQAVDPRQRLTIVARYSDGRAQAAFARAERVLAAAKNLPPATRTVVERAGVDDLSATLTWDVAGAGTPDPMARPLQ